MAELLSSSDDESGSPVAASAASRAFATPSPSSMAASWSSRRAVPAEKGLDDDLMSLLVDGPAVESKRGVSGAGARPTKAERPSSSSSSSSSRLESGSSWRSGLDAPKKVVSARELLMNLMPRRPNSAESKKETSTLVQTVGGARSLLVEQVGQKQVDEKELSASERIARKYGFKPSGAFSKSATATDDFKTIGKQQQFKESVESTRQSKPSVEPELPSRKKTFWEEQLDGASNVATPRSKYVSPFRSAETFEDMRNKRRQSLETRNDSEKKQANDRRHSVDTTVAGSVVSASASNDNDRRPSRFSTSDADDDLWFSDASGNEPEKVVGTALTPGLSAEKASPSGGHSAPLSAPRIQTRAPRKRKRQSMDLQQDAADGFDEHWPKLPPPSNEVGPMELSIPEGMPPANLFVCANINNYLFDYQREGVEFLARAYLNNTGAILGDEMGLGKTIQVIALLAAIMKKTGQSEDKQAWRELRKARREQCHHGGGDPFRGGPAPILIVVPASLLHNWESELNIWLCCSTIILHGKPQEREALLDQIERGEFEVVICSYDILKILIERLHVIAWEVVILDEMHCLKNPDAQLTKAVKAVKCKKKIGLTGTLMQNNEKELHCLVDTIAPGVLGSWPEFRIYYGNDIKYGRKKSAAREALERSRLKEKKLRQKLVPYYLRREKEINPQFQEVKKRDQVVFCDLTPLQLAAYKRILAMPEFELLRGGEEPCDCDRPSKRKRKMCCYHTPMDIGASESEAIIWSRFHRNGQGCRKCPNCMGLVCVAQLLKLSNHMELLKVNPRDPPEIQAYAARFARKAFGEDVDAVGGVHQVTTFRETRALGTTTCGKMLVLEKLLAVWQRRRQKTLLFSRSTRMLDILQFFLISKAIGYSRLDGNTKVDERLQLVNDFNRGDSNVSVFLISTKAGGVGLNLPSATNVVIFDPSWNPAHDCQAQDRAYRIGQTKDVQVYRLITLGTIEEMIYVRQIYKQQLSDTTLKGAKAPRYFEGVQGDRRNQGELFGIKNLLCWKEGGVLKDIQDAYQRDSNGIILQENRFMYEKPQASKGRKSKNRESSVDENEEEMVEVADELVADVLQTQTSVSTNGEVTSAETVSQIEKDDPLESDDEEFSLPGATSIMHEAIVGEQEFGGDSPLSDMDEIELDAKRESVEIDEDGLVLPGATTALHDAIIGEQDGAEDSLFNDVEVPSSGDKRDSENTSQPEGEERAEKKPRSDRSKPVVIDLTSPRPSSRPAHPAIANKKSGAALGVDKAATPTRQGLYVPKYV